MDRAQRNNAIKDADSARGSSSTQRAEWKTRAESFSCEKLTKDMLVSAASHYSRGQLPVLHRALLLSENSHRNDESFLCYSLYSPFNAISSCYRRIVNAIGSQSILSLFPFSAASLQMLLVIALYALFGFDGILSALPSVLYFGTLCVMLISTCSILMKRWEFRHFRRWSDLLVAWGGDGVNPQDAQWAHCANNIRPCYIYLISLLLNVSLTPFVPVFNIPHSEVAVLSTACSLILLYTFAWENGKIDFPILFSFGVHLLARYPYETDEVVFQGWRFLDVHVPTFASYVVGNGIEFCLNFRVIFYLMLPIMLLKLASRNRWKGIYTSLIPHLVTLSWWQVAVTASTGATWYGLIRSALAIVGLFVFLPLAGAATLFLPLVAVVKFLTGQQFPIPVSVALSCALCITVLYLGRKRIGQSKLVGFFQLLLGVASSILLIVTLVRPTPGEVFSRSTPLTWAQYHEYCSHSSSDLKAASQEKCSALNGLYIHWEGKVISTSISKVYNPIAQLINTLPIKIQEPLACVFGEPFEVCDKDSNCSVPPALQHKCQLSKWNQYEYEIRVNLHLGIWAGDEMVAVLRAGTTFRNFTQALSKGDKIWFSGLLQGDSSGVLDWQTPRLSVHQAGCLACTANPPTTVHSLLAPYASLDLYNIGKHLLNFFFNPLVIFK